MDGRLPSCDDGGFGRIVRYREEREQGGADRLGIVPVLVQHLVLDRMARYDLALPRRGDSAASQSPGERFEHVGELAW